MPSSYPIYPTPTQGSGSPFGAVPGPISLPDPFGDLSKAFPALGGANVAAGTDLQAQLGGVVSPATMNALKLASAQFGVGSGMGPASGLATNQLFGNIAGFSEAQQQKGLQNYASLIPAISATQTVSPALQADIAARNAMMAAAPSPAAAASYAEQLFNEYLNKVHGPQGGFRIVGGPAGGTKPAAPTPDYAWAGASPPSPVGGGGVGLPAGGIPPFDWMSATFGARPTMTAAPTRTAGPGNIYMGSQPPMYADEWDALMGMGPETSLTNVGPGGLPGTEGEYGGSAANLGDLLAGASGDIYSELGI